MLREHLEGYKDDHGVLCKPKMPTTEAESARMAERTSNPQGIVRWTSGRC